MHVLILTLGMQCEGSDIQAVFPDTSEGFAAAHDAAETVMASRGGSWSLVPTHAVDSSSVERSWTDDCEWLSIERWEVRGAHPER